MGYTTEFDGRFEFNTPLDDDTKHFLTEFARVRHMKRNVDPAKYGHEGEFYIDGPGYAGQEREDNITDYNSPPQGVPGLWNHWVPSDDGRYLEWDGGEKFYSYVEWLNYIIRNFLKPKGYVLNGEMFYQGEDENDCGRIYIKNNIVSLTP